MKSMKTSKLISVFILFLAIFSVSNKSISIKKNSISFIENKYPAYLLEDEDDDYVPNGLFRIIAKNLNHFKSYVIVEDKGLLSSSKYNLNEESLWEVEQIKNVKNVKKNIFMLKNKKTGLYLDANQRKNESKSLIGVSKKNDSNSQIWYLDQHHLRNYDTDNCLRCGQGDERYYGCYFDVQKCAYDTETQKFHFEIPF
jgi:hypothetical protein